MNRLLPASSCSVLMLLVALGVTAMHSVALAAGDEFAEWEIRREQELARRDMAERDRVLAEALRNQQEAIRQLEATGSRLEGAARENARQQLELSRSYGEPYGTTPSLSPVTPEARELLERLRQEDTIRGMTLAPLSERLGSYFGVTSGVLVVRAGAGANFGLQDGDVILSIDGRAPADAQHANRILRSYRPGESVRLRVQRDRQAVDLR